MNNFNLKNFQTNFILENDLLPEHYEKIDEPVYKGSGNHSVRELEKICKQYQEFVHQQRIREQVILEKSDSVIVRRLPNCREIGRFHIVDSSKTTHCNYCGHEINENKKDENNFEKI